MKFVSIYIYNLTIYLVDMRSLKLTIYLHVKTIITPQPLPSKQPALTLVLPSCFLLSVTAFAVTTTIVVAIEQHMGFCIHFSLFL